MRKTMVCAFSILVLSCVFVLCAAGDGMFSEWSPPINLGPDINTSSMETCVAISKNRLTLYFATNRAGGLAGGDLWVSQRATVNDKWGAPKWLGAVINTANADYCPALGLDEHELFFRTQPPGGASSDADLYVTRRTDRWDDFGWGPPQNLGADANGGPNSAWSEIAPAFFEDEAGREIMYFSSNRRGSSQDRIGSQELYSSVRRADGSFGPAELIPELSTSEPTSQWGVTVRRDGLEVIFSSNRSGSTPAPDGKSVSNDLWVATRRSTSDPWSAPARLPVLSTPYFEGGRMSMSLDGLTLFFASDREGSLGSRDVYVATRTRLK